MQSLYLVMPLDPTDSKDWTQHNNISVTMKDIGANLTHSHGIRAIPSTSTIERSFRIGGVWDQLGNTDAGDYAGSQDLTISGGLEWEANASDNNNLTMLKSTITINNVDIILGRVAVDQTIRNIIDEYSYNKETIDQKVEEAFKKGWEDGWTNIRLEPELSEITGSSSNTFSVWAHFDTYTCQYGTEITGRDGMLAGQKRINFDIKDFQYWKETAFEYFDYDGNNKITAMAKDRSTELGYTHAYLNVKTYQTGSKQYEYSIRTGQYSSGTEIASGEIGAVAAYNDGWNNAYQMIDWPSLGSGVTSAYMQIPAQTVNRSSGRTIKIAGYNEGTVQINKNNGGWQNTTSTSVSIPGHYESNGQETAHRYLYTDSSGGWAYYSEYKGSSYDGRTYQTDITVTYNKYKWVNADTVYIEARLNGASEGYLSYSY